MLIDSCSFSSASLLLSNISDPEYVSRLCQPIIHESIPNEAFSQDFILETILPQIKDIIKNCKKSQFSNIPQIIRLMIDNYPEVGVNVIKNVGG